MDLSNLKPPAGQVKVQRRIGRGMGSGRGKYSGRGAKGAGFERDWSTRCGGSADVSRLRLSVT